MLTQNKQVLIQNFLNATDPKTTEKEITFTEEDKIPKGWCPTCGQLWKEHNLKYCAEVTNKTFSAELAAQTRIENEGAEFRLPTGTKLAIGFKMIKGMEDIPY